MTRIETDFGDVIEEAGERFGDHEDMSQGRLIRWLKQFPDEDLPLAIEVIRAVRYVNGLNIRTMTSHLFEIAGQELARRNFARAAFVAVGSLGSGSGTVARVLRELLRGTQHRMLTMLDIQRLRPGEVDAIIFVDDFSGTGKTLGEWWDNVEPLVRPTNAAVFVGLLVLNGRARERIEQFADVFAVEELGERDNVLSSDYGEFSEEKRARLLEHCRRTDCGPKYEKGYGQCGLLLAFKHGCPNNSLPILWYQGKRWIPLFKRRAI